MYRNVARQLNISVAMESMVSDAFIGVATEIFSTGTCTHIGLFWVLQNLDGAQCVQKAEPDSSQQTTVKWFEWKTFCSLNCILIEMQSQWVDEIWSPESCLYSCIPFLFTLLLTLGRGGAAAYPSCLSSKAVLHSGQVATLSQSHIERQPFTITYLGLICPHVRL